MRRRILAAAMLAVLAATASPAGAVTLPPVEDLRQAFVAEAESIADPRTASLPLPLRSPRVRRDRTPLRRRIRRRLL